MTEYNSKPYEILGASFGLGSYEKGTAFGPHSFLSHGLIDALQRVRRDTVMGRILEPMYLPFGKEPRSVRFLDEFLSFHEKLSKEVECIYSAGRRPLILGGDHAISISTISTAAQWLRKTQGPDCSIGVLWIDSHTDINSDESSVTKNIHGMPLRVLLNEGDKMLTALNGGKPSIKHENIVYIGIRDVDEPEKEYVRSKGIRHYSMRDIDARGIGSVIIEAAEYLQKNTSGVIASFDLDACDPVIAPGVGTPVRAGLTERESHFIMEEIAHMPNLLSVELVELNPELDKHAQTAQIGIRLLESALGKRII